MTRHLANSPDRYPSSNCSRIGRRKRFLSEHQQSWSELGAKVVNGHPEVATVNRTRRTDTLSANEVRFTVDQGEGPEDAKPR